MQAISNAKVLLVDDDRAIRCALGDSLSRAGFMVHKARSGKEALRLFAARRPDVVLLDVMMPGMDGFAVCREMRRLDRETPIVFLSALDSERDQVRGLSLGADDYVSKSASEFLLFARIGKAIERADRFSRMDAPLSMTKMEADVFRFLESNRGRFCSAHEILSAVRGEGYEADEGSIRVHVSHLRAKLPNGMSVLTRRNGGYALVEE